MDSNYDEDLNENIFFKTLKTEQNELYQKCLLEGWLICVPRVGSLPKYSFTRSDFFSHILVPSDELPETHFRSLNDTEVRISNKVLTIESSESLEPFSTHILFEETYYTEDFLKYKVLCVEAPLDHYPDGGRGESGIITISTLRDCIDLLWTEGCKEVLVQIDEIISNFITSHPDLETKSLQVQKDLVGGLYTHCLQVTLKDARLREKTSVSVHLLDSVKLSVESYMHHGIYKKLIKGITTCTAYEDAQLNKIIRNLSDLQLRDLGIGNEFSESVPRARSELSKVESYSTVLGKIGCLQRTVNSISCKGIKNQPVGADDLLPMLVFLVVKSGLPNWIAHLTYMTEFSFLTSTYFADRYNFLVTSLQAAVEHIKNGYLTGPTEPESQIEDVDTPSVLLNSEEESDVQEGNLSGLFEFVRCGNYEQVERLLGDSNKEKKKEIGSLKLCHPLCSCDSCEKSISQAMCDTSPTVNSCDDKGFTILHVAATHGRPRVIDLSLSLGANPNVTDYKGWTPLHYAASRGHQNVLLLLAHAGSSLNAEDNEGNTPLHLASSNGHEECVKAFLYFAEYDRVRLDVNAKNNRGDTPLHYASRWGYENIVKLLLDYDADPFVKNKLKLTPLDYAHNLNISKILRSQFVKIDLSKEIPVAAASKRSLDLTDERQQSIRPNTTEEIKKLDRLLNAIAHGDLRLTLFYMGLDPSILNESSEFCHPLCECRNGSGNCSKKTPEINTINPLVNVSNADGITPLHMAAKYGREKILKILLDWGGDTSCRTRTSHATALHWACQNRSTACARILLERSHNDIDAQDGAGNTALHYACDTANLNLAQILLTYSPKVNIKNYQNQTPVDIAKKIMSLSLVRLLTCFK